MPLTLYAFFCESGCEGLMSNQVGLEKVEVARLQGVDEGGLLVGGRVGLAKVDVGEERGAVALTLYAFFL